MPRIFSRYGSFAIFFYLIPLALPTSLRAQEDVAKVYKKNCVLCHAADGSGNTPSGKALGAKDLASNEVQKKSDAELTEFITKGKGKMPAFAAKLKADEIRQLVAYIRSMDKKIGGRGLAGPSEAGTPLCSVTAYAGERYVFSR